MSQDVMFKVYQPTHEATTKDDNTMVSCLALLVSLTLRFEMLNLTGVYFESILSDNDQIFLDIFPFIINDDTS